MKALASLPAEKKKIRCHNITEIAEIPRTPCQCEYRQTSTISGSLVSYIVQLSGSQIYGISLIFTY